MVFVHKAFFMLFLSQIDLLHLRSIYFDMLILNDHILGVEVSHVLNFFSLVNFSTIPEQSSMNKGSSASLIS